MYKTETDFFDGSKHFLFFFYLKFNPARYLKSKEEDYFHPILIIILVVISKLTFNICIILEIFLMVIQYLAIQTFIKI